MCYLVILKMLLKGKIKVNVGSETAKPYSKRERNNEKLILCYLVILKIILKGKIKVNVGSETAKPYSKKKKNDEKHSIFCVLLE